MVIFITNGIRNGSEAETNNNSEPKSAKVETNTASKNSKEKKSSSVKKTCS